MRRAMICLAVMTTVAHADGLAHTGPSGLVYVSQDMLFEPAGAYDGARRSVRLRFVAAELADEDSFGFEKIEADLDALCQALAPDIVAKFAPNAREIIVSVASEPVVFGESAPNVVQYFDLFRLENNTCVWEGI